LRQVGIRVNTVHLTGCQLANDHDEAFGRFVQEFPTIAANLQNPLPVEDGLIEPEAVTNTILHLVSDTGRYITGSTVLVNAGFTNK
jgi:NAD(P)-dependent dehydrogenase (short-subunit alcohol dehydrogenase family)